MAGYDATSRFDLAVIGSDPGGYRAAVLAALRGLKVAIVEKGDWGGCCPNRGCVPKKTWYHSALDAASRGHAARGIEGALHGDLAQAWRHQHGVVASVRESYVDYATETLAAKWGLRKEIFGMTTAPQAGEQE